MQQTFPGAKTLLLIQFYALLILAELCVHDQREKIWKIKLTRGPFCMNMQ